jgi:membrane glycosyltransferase
MALVKIDEKTIVQKIKQAVLGKEKPALLRRVSVIIGFLIWLYFLIWQGLIFLSIVFMNRLQNPEIVKETFQKVGTQYTFMHRWGLTTTNTLIIYSIIFFILFGFSLLGLILIYRKKKTGHIIYFMSNVILIIITLIFLGIKYVINEITLFDQVLYATTTLYFGLGILFFKRPKPIKTNDE